ncbi:hypothetical protein N9B72_01440 [Bacteriovoracaceae bacterium]|nr:hypothetical protein [Bacteriovoracaceae bacterium]
MLYQEEKENLHVTYQLLAAGFAKSDEDFKIVFNKIKNQHGLILKVFGLLEVIAVILKSMEMS